MCSSTESLRRLRRSFKASTRRRMKTTRSVLTIRLGSSSRIRLIAWRLSTPRRTSWGKRLKIRNARMTSWKARLVTWATKCVRDSRSLISSRPPVTTLPTIPASRSWLLRTNAAWSMSSSNKRKKLCSSRMSSIVSVQELSPVSPISRTRLTTLMRGDIVRGSEIPNEVLSLI